MFKITAQASKWGANSSIKALKVASGSFLIFNTFSVVACSAGPAKSMGKVVAQAELQPKSGSKAMGRLKFVQVNSGVQVVGAFRNLKPMTAHGFHVHEKGDCSSKDAKSAGGHFNPGGHDHGHLHSEHSHAGDLGNVMSDKNGVAQVDVFKKGISLSSSSDLPSILGKSVVLHSHRDDLKPVASGNAGPRIGCGVITKATF